MSKSNVYNEWHHSLGQRVCVKENIFGILRYFGETYFAEGYWCGIELDEAIGENDGKVDNFRYFACKSNFGIFVPVSEASLLKQTSDVNKNSAFLMVNHFKDMKQFPSNSEIQKSTHNSAIVKNDQLISYDELSQKSALNESYIITNDYPDKNKLSIIVEECDQILDTTFNFSHMCRISALDKPDDVRSTSWSHVLSQTFTDTVSSSQLKELHDKNIKENDRNFLESDESLESLGILPSALLELSDDLLDDVEVPYYNRNKDLNNKFQEIISNSPIHNNLDETFHSTCHAANSILGIQNYESPILQNDSSLPKFASTPKHETDFSEITEQIEKALNMTHNLSPESYVHHFSEMPHKSVDYTKFVKKDDTYIEETHLSTTPVNKSVKDSIAQYVDGISECMNYTNPIMKTAKDLNITQSMECIVKDLKHSTTFTERIDLNSTQYVEDLKYVKSDESVKDFKVTHATYIEVSKENVDLNVTRSMQNNSEDLKYMCRNESLEDFNVTQCISGITEGIKYESLDESFKDLNATHCVDDVSKNLKNDQSFNKKATDLNITQDIESISENIKYDELCDENINLNVTQCLENKAENLISLTLTYPSEPDYRSDKYFNENQCSFKVHKDLILQEKTSEILNVPHENDFKFPELNSDITSLQSSKLSKVSIKENIKSLECVPEIRGRKSDFYAKSDASSSKSKIKFKRHIIRKSVGCFSNELRTDLTEKQIRRNSLSGNTSLKGDISKAKVTSHFEKMPFKFSAKENCVISNPSRIAASQEKLMSSQTISVSKSGIIKNINRNNLGKSTLNVKSPNFIADKKDAKQSIQAEFKVNKPCLLNETIYLDEKIEDAGKTVVKKPRDSMGFFNTKKTTEQNGISCGNRVVLNEDKHLDCETNEVGKTVIKKPRCSMKFSSIQSSSSVQNSIPYRNTKEKLLHEVKDLGNSIKEGGKTIIKKSRSSMKFCGIREASDHDAISLENDDFLNETKYLDTQITEVGKTVIKKPRCSMKFSSIQSSSSVHNGVPYRNTKERLLNNVKNLDCQTEKVGKAGTEKQRSLINFSTTEETSSQLQSIPCRSNAESSFNEGKYLDHQISEVGKTVIKKPRNSTNFASFPQISSKHNSIPSKKKMVCDKNMLPSKGENYLNKVTKKLSIGSALNEKQNKIARTLKYASIEKPKSAIPPPSSINGNKISLGKGVNYKSTPRKQECRLKDLNVTLPFSSQKGGSKQKTAACIPKRTSQISRSRTALNEGRNLDKRAISDNVVLPNQETSCKQNSEVLGKSHEMNLRTGPPVSRIKPPAKYCSR